MDVIDNKINGFAFMDSLDYKEAKKEAESIEYIKANNDLEDLNKSVKLYQKLVERKTLRTVVGFAFLNELRERILKEGIITKDSLPCIIVEKNTRQLKLFSGSEQELEKKHREEVDNLRLRLKNSRIISIFLIGIIIIMMALAVFSNRTKYSNYEKQILNKYSAWEEDLDAREKALKEKEDLQFGE